MAQSNWSGPINSDNGFMSSVRYVLGASTTTINIEPGCTYVIIAENQGGPTGACTLVLPKVTSGTFDPSFGDNQPADPNYNGIQGSVLNQSTTLTHKLAAFSGQTISGLAEVSIAPATVVQWAGNGNQSAPWVAISNPLLAA
jgi:hypothetical protein